MSIKNVLFSLLLVVCYLLVAQPSGYADSYSLPLTNNVFVKEGDQDIGARILKSYNGPSLSENSPAEEQALLAFTIYKNGGTKWYRRPCLNFLRGKIIDDQIFLSLRKALQCSSPLNLNGLGVSDPTTAILYKKNLSRRVSLRVGFDETVINGRYEFDEGCGAFDRSSWLLTNLKLITKKIRIPKPLNAKALAVVWFRLNPDGSVDGCKEIPLESRKIFPLKASTKIADLMCSGIKESHPLVFMNTRTEPGAPRGLILIYDGRIKNPFRLSPVDYRSSQLEFSLRKCSKKHSK